MDRLRKKFGDAAVVKGLAFDRLDDDEDQAADDDDRRPPYLQGLVSLISIEVSSPLMAKSL
jgi:hypothetical protein